MSKAQSDFCGTVSGITSIFLCHSIHVPSSIALVLVSLICLLYIFLYKNLFLGMSEAQSDFSDAGYSTIRFACYCHLIHKALSVRINSLLHLVLYNDK